MNDKFYVPAQICLNGDICNSDMAYHQEVNKQYCPKCGQKTIDECQFCHTKLQGDYGCMSRDILKGQLHFHVFKRLSTPPAYCHNCGKPYPWTEATMRAAEHIIDMLDDLTEDQKKQLVDFIPDIIVETPQSRYAALVYAKFLDGLQGLAVDCFKDWCKKNVFPTLLVLLNMQKQ